MAYFHVAGRDADGVRTRSVRDCEESCRALVEGRSRAAAVRVPGEQRATGPTSSASIDVGHLVITELPQMEGRDPRHDHDDVRVLQTHSLLTAARSVTPA